MGWFGGRPRDQGSEVQQIRSAKGRQTSSNIEIEGLQARQCERVKENHCPDLEKYLAELDVLDNNQLPGSIQTEKQNNHGSNFFLIGYPFLFGFVEDVNMLRRQTKEGFYKFLTLYFCYHESPRVATRL